MAPRFEVYFDQHLNDKSSDDMYRKILKVILEFQDIILSDSQKPCMRDHSLSFECSRGCHTDHKDAIVELETMIKSKLGRCSFYQRQFGNKFDELKNLFSISATGIELFFPSLIKPYCPIRCALIVS